MTLDGIDISHHQAETPDLTALDFVICRATYGTTPDRLYPMHAANVRAAGKILGAYHFARPTTFGSAVEQAEAFLTAAPDADFWVVDREKDGDNGTITLAATRAFVDAVHATGRRVGLYTSMSNWREVGQDFAWVARWNTEEPTIPWDIWQYRGAPLDLDRFRGTTGAMLALGAPLREWVDAQADLAADELAKAQADADAYAFDLALTLEALDEANGTIDALDAEIADVSNGLRLVREFEERHP